VVSAKTQRPQLAGGVDAPKVSYNEHMRKAIVRPTTSQVSHRVHVVIPEELLQDIDALVGPRRRSEFLVDAAREKIARERLRRVAHELAGSLKASRTPGWETPEAVSQWVRSLRRENDEEALPAADRA
jgi:hypothetical protein